MILKKRNRKFFVGKNKDICLTDIGSIFLKNNNNLNIHFSKKTSYDICKKSWGFYCLPSINKRLINLNFSTFLVENLTFKKFFILIVVNNKKCLKNFTKYCKRENLKIILELNNKNLIKLKKNSDEFKK